MYPQLSLAANAAIFLAAALVIGLAGVALTRKADALADRTGLGEALVGAVLLGITTSLSGTVTSVAAAAAGHVALSVSNAIGGIAVQTAFLAVADIFYRRANLEHAAAEATSLVQAALLILLLSIPLTALAMPELTLWAVHPASPVLFVVYLAGLRLTHAARRRPMWRPAVTGETRHDRPERRSRREPRAAVLTLQFAVLMAAVAAAGWAIAESGGSIARQSGLSQTIVGALFAAVATSLPELVTTVAAVRRGALQLAVGGIIGGNTYDVLFLAFSDAAYRDGSLYHAMEGRHVFLIALGILMNALLLLGLLRRQRFGLGNIGFESILLLAVYAAGVAVQVALG